MFVCHYTYRFFHSSCPKVQVLGLLASIGCCGSPNVIGGRSMKKCGLIGLALAVPGGIAAISAAQAGDAAPSHHKATVDCKAPDAPYKNYDCLDPYLGDGFFERLVNYYKLEWGHEGAPVDPKAPPARRAGWADAPAAVPPYPFTEWPYGGATSIGVTRPASADSPLMVALANTDLGKTLSAGNMQIYGWINGGGNI